VLIYLFGGTIKVCSVLYCWQSVMLSDGKSHVVSYTQMCQTSGCYYIVILSKKFCVNISDY